MVDDHETTSSPVVDHETENMSDKELVERLRRTYRKEYAPTGSSVGDISNRLRPFPILATELLFNPDGPAAADRIEALSAEVERLSTQNVALHDAYYSKTHHLSYAVIKEKNDQLETDVERLRKALISIRGWGVCKWSVSIARAALEDGK